MTKYPVILLILLLAFSCKSKDAGEDLLFTQLPVSHTHVDFANNLTETEAMNMIEYLYFNNGGGVAAGDINNDGLVDLYFTASQLPNRLYLNKGNLTFEDITEKAGVAGSGTWSTGVTMADVNNDGYLDIYLCHVGNYKGLEGKNQLFINRGDLTFEDKAPEYGLDFRGFSTQAAFFDYDLDGDLDMYLLNHSVHTSRSYGGITLRLDQDPRAGDRLYRNDIKDGTGRFHDVTRQAGIFSSQIGYGLGVNISDINNDGYPDIYISNDFHENDYLYINLQNGTFSEELTRHIAHTSRSSMGNDVADFNNDGLMDIVVLDMLPDEEKIRKQSGGEDDYDLFELKRKYGYSAQFVRNTLQLNLGGGLFSEIGRLAGIYSTDWSWSPLLFDMDNDGWKDLFISNGIFRRANDLDYVKYLTGGNRYAPVKDNSTLPDRVLYEKMPVYPHANFYFRNDTDLTFTNRGEQWRGNTSSISNGATYADLDNDGDLDIVVNNINEHAFVLRNNAETVLRHHYLSMVFREEGGNPRGVGTRATVWSGGKQQMVENYTTRGFMSSTSDVLHIGLGETGMIDSVVIRWPDRTIQVLRQVPADTLLTVVKNQTCPPVAPGRTDIEKRWFKQAQIPGLEFRHHENNYSDFTREQLTPHSLSNEGPALAVADINGDGLEDLFIGGASGQTAMFFIQEKEGRFIPVTNPVLTHEAPAEDVDAAFFDADADGDQDLYIVRGGNEYREGNPLLTDCLLINDGKGGFTKDTRGFLPYMAYNGSCVRPADFDLDGDIDLFVGSRSVPGAYGWTPRQILLENVGHGQFEDVTSFRFSDAGQTGMVTDAEWTDLNGDGYPELFLTGEWMGIMMFANTDGILVDKTAGTGLEQTSGWWYALTIADIDLDGDPDIIAGNLGWNSIFTASPEEPLTLYLNDFDNNGSLDQILCTYQQGKSYPVASLDELNRQITGFNKQFPDYAGFGGKSVQDIFGKKLLDESVVKKIVMLESTVFVNDGHGHFSVQTLPVQAQFSPVRDILVETVNHDRFPDLLLAGNDLAVRPSVGNYDASYGWCMLGDSLHQFSPLMPVQSGFVVIGDARRIVPVKIKGKSYEVVAVNDGPLYVFEH